MKQSKNIPEFIKCGYGRISRLVMRSKKLSIEAKSIYSYLVSFAGNNYKCYPKLTMMVSELGISNKRFYKNLKQLIEFGLISTRRIKTNGKWVKTIYIIENIPLSQFDLIQIELMHNEKLIVTDSNSNSIKSNNIYISLQEMENYFIQKYLKEYKNKFGKEHFRLSVKHKDTIDDLTMITFDTDKEDIDIAVEDHFKTLPKNNNGSILYFANLGVLTRLFEDTDIYNYPE